MSRRQTRNNQSEPEFMTRHEWQSERQQLMKDFENKMKSQNKSLHHKMDRLLEIHASSVNADAPSYNREADSVEVATNSEIHRQDTLVTDSELQLGNQFTRTCQSTFESEVPRSDIGSEK